jgi:HK97 family phage major capsid protein
MAEDIETKSVEQYLEDLEKGITTFNAKFEPVNAQFKTMQERIDGLETKLNTPEAGPMASFDAKAIDLEWRTSYLDYILTGKGFDQDSIIDQYKDAVPEFKKTMISTNLTTGGYWMPATLSARIIEALVNISPFRALASVETLKVGDTLEMINEVGAVMAGWTSESTVGRAATLNPTLGKISIPTHPMYAMPTLTQKMARQGSVDVEAWLVRKVSEYMAFLEGHEFILGNGAGKPEGISFRGDAHIAANTVARHEHTGAATSIPDLDGVIAMQDKLNERFQANASWLMNRTTKSVIRRLTDGMGRYILEENVQIGQPDRLFGKPIYYMPDMATVTTAPSTFTAADCVIIYGDIREAYQIVDMPGMVQIRDEISTKGLVQLYTERLGIGGQVVNDNAFVVMNVSA